MTEAASPTAPQAAPEPTVLARRQGRIGHLTLNRPRALNALDPGMIAAMAAALDAWRDDPAVHAVVVEGAGGRAFCAGGDVREIRRAVLAGEHDAVEAFFAAEYALNLAIARYPKPYVAIVDGICMGGGIGVSVHGSVRVATEAAMFAMPETAIALFPDVGATYILPRLRGAFGMYMALTGARLGGADATWAGLATHFVPRDRLPGLVDALAADGVAALAGHAVPPVPTAAVHHDLSAFAAGSVPAILAALEAQAAGPDAGSGWARDTLKTLREVSPSSVLWSFAAVRQGAGRTLEQCLDAELALTRHATRHPDFAEGVRAAVVDKDRTPRWSPARIEDVDPATLPA